MSVHVLIKRLLEIEPQPYILPEYQFILEASLEIRRVSDIAAWFPTGSTAISLPQVSGISIPKLPPAKAQAAPLEAKLTKALNTFL